MRTTLLRKAPKPKEVEKVVGILTVEELARLLETAPPDLIPYLAIGAFAGLRRAELERLDWKEIDLQSGLIEVTANNAKSARRRFVRIQPNLSEWLTPHERLGGDVTPPRYADLMANARTSARIEQWPQNALRHSFASYHLAHFKDAAALALELGHTNSNLVFQHYRQLVKPKQAERYWKVAPASPARTLWPLRMRRVDARQRLSRRVCNELADAQDVAHPGAGVHTGVNSSTRCWISQRKI